MSRYNQTFVFYLDIYNALGKPSLKSHYRPVSELSVSLQGFLTLPCIYLSPKIETLISGAFIAQILVISHIFACLYRLCKLKAMENINIEYYIIKYHSYHKLTQVSLI